MLTAYYVAAYSSTKEVLLIPKNPPAWGVLRWRSGGGALRLSCAWHRLLQSVSLADYTSPVGRQQGGRHMEVLMHPTQRLEECVARMTPEQYARLLAFAEALLADGLAPSAHDTAQQAVETAALQHRIQHAFPDNLRQRLRALTRKSEVEALNADERAEYITLAEQREEADAERLQAVLRLAQLRGVPPTQLLEECGIGTTGHG